MKDPLQQIAALLPQLSHAELRVLLVLTATPKRSPRDIATAAGLARSNAQSAMHSLTQKGIISSDGGTATRAARVELAFLAVEILPNSSPRTWP